MGGLNDTDDTVIRRAKEPNKPVSKDIVICEQDKLAAMIENGRVVEFFLNEGEQQVGDIVLGRVESIVPAIEAAFVNIGREKNGFIHVADLASTRARSDGIKQSLKLKQSLLVQVAKEPTGNKGARLTALLSIPGRYLVLTPFERRVGISKRITSDAERNRLLRIMQRISGTGYGVVVRTEAIGQGEAALQEDLDMLVKRWQEILKLSEEVQPPHLLYRDADMLTRIMREVFSPDIRRVTVDTESGYRRAEELLRGWGLDTSKLRLHAGSHSLASQMGIIRELEMALQPKVILPSGGYLVIEQTEALTVIDVNSGRLTSPSGIKETILQTNREAASEVARQVRLRDIGGVVVVDFIDMDDPRDQQIVWQTLAEAIKPDKSQPHISYFSDIGLIEMTRRRQRQSLLEQLSLPCPHCQGVGRVRNNLYRQDLLSGEALGSGTISDILRDIIHEPVAVERPSGVQPREGSAVAGVPVAPALSDRRDERPWARAARRPVHERPAVPADLSLPHPVRLDIPQLGPLARERWSPPPVQRLELPELWGEAQVQVEALSIPSLADLGFGGSLVPVVSSESEQIRAEPAVEPGPEPVTVGEAEPPVPVAKPKLAPLRRLRSFAPRRR